MDIILNMDEQIQRISITITKNLERPVNEAFSAFIYFQNNSNTTTSLITRSWFDIKALAMINSINNSLIEIIYILDTIKSMTLNSHEARSKIKLHKVCNINILIRRLTNSISDKNLNTIREFLISKLLSLDTIIVSFLQELLVGNSFNYILRTQFIEPFNSVLETSHIIFKSAKGKQMNSDIKNFTEILCQYSRCTRTSTTFN